MNGQRKVATVLATAACIAASAVATTTPAEAVCGVKNSSTSIGPFWADGKKINPGHTAPCGSDYFHTGCRYVAYRGGSIAFGCTAKKLSSAYTGSVVRVGY